MNFAAQKLTNQNQNTALDDAIRAAKTQAAAAHRDTTSHSAAPAPAAPAPTSAQAIINARYQASSASGAGSSTALAGSAAAGSIYSRPSLSARDAINSHSTLTPAEPERAKSASRLHRGFIQKSLESTRTSASAMLKSSGGDAEDAPVIRTSLKLGADARPQKPVVTLPPGSRMARVAKALDQPAAELPAASASPAKSSAKLAPKKSSPKALAAKSGLKINVGSDPDAADLALDSGDTSAGTKPRKALSAKSSRSSGSAKARSVKSLSSKITQIPVAAKGEHRITVESSDDSSSDSPSSSDSKSSRSAAKSQPKSSKRAVRKPLGLGKKSSAAAIGLAAARTSRRKVSDPQMLVPHRKSAARGLRPQSFPAPAERQTPPDRQVASARASSARSRASAAPLYPPAPADFSSRPSAAHTSQELKSRFGATSVGQLDELGVVEDYTDSAPRPASPRESDASGSASGLSARNLKNPKAHQAEDSRRTLGKQSPFFLKSVTVEKRPLSHETAGTGHVATMPRGVQSGKDAPSSPQLGAVRTVASKSVFAKSAPKAKSHKSQSSSAPRSAVDQPTVIVPSSSRSSAPLVFLVIITILLGAAVGAAAYLCFFQ